MIYKSFLNSSIKYLLFTILWIFLFSHNAISVEISLTTDFAADNDKVIAAVQYNIPPEYHAYSHKPGGDGLPTDLNFTLETVGQVKILYPQGQRESDIFDPNIKVNVYNGAVTLLAILPMQAGGKLYAANLDMLLCSSRRCVPLKQSFSGHVPEILPELTSVPWHGQALELLAMQKNKSAPLSLEEGVAPPPIESDSQADLTQNDSRSKDIGDSNITAESSEKDKAGQSIMGAPEDFDLALQPQYADSNLEIYSLGKALLMGLIAGLLLNAMPCVLPVLTLKVTGLLLMGNLDQKQKLRAFREHNLCFAAGILTLFAFLAFLLGLADLMWGQLYQNQAILLVMLLLVFLMGLSMLGVFTLPAFDLRLGENTRNPKLKSYFTGLISTFLATPCSGPMLGGALAWAFTQSMPILLAVFLAIGFGMALPYIVFSIWPNMAKILPRPGNWMYVFEHILGFLLLATALYLLSILPSDKHMQVLGVLLVVSTCAWLWGKFCGLDAPRTRRRIMGATGGVLICCAIFWILQPISPAPKWQEFSPETFAEDMGKKAMLVEFTADWCPNCKFLEASVLSASNLRAWKKRYNMELIKVDLTHPDPYGEKLLEMLGSKSIPLTAIFPAGEDSDRPLVLRDIYGEKSLDNALSETLGQS